MILELKKNINSYQPFWSDWVQSEECTLNEEDLYVIEVHLRNDFKVKLYETFMFFNQTKKIENIVAKLILDYQKFKAWVINNFVFSLMKLIRENNFNNYFLHLPLDYTQVPNELKDKLKLFKIKTVYEIFERYREEDFYVEPVFKNIVAFQKALHKNTINQ